MSLETLISNLTTAVQQLTAVMQGAPAGAAPLAQAAPAAAATPFTAPAAAPAPTAAPAGMPAAPFAAPAAAPAACPLTDAKTFMDYSVASYNAIQTAKGQEVANQRFAQILTSCGVDNLNNVPLAMYPNFYNLMEQAKVA